MSSVGGVGRLNPELIEDIMFRLSCGERHNYCLADPRDVGPVCMTDRHKNECANEWNGTFEDENRVTHHERALPFTYHAFLTLRLSADGSRAALLYTNGDVMNRNLFLFDTESWTQIGNAFNISPVSDLNFVLSDDGMKIASVYQNRVYIWNMALSYTYRPVVNELYHTTELDDYAPLSPFSHRFQQIWLNSYSFNHSGTLFLTSRDDSIIIWDIVSTFAAIRTLKNHDDLYGLWHPMRDRTVVFTNTNGDLMLWSISEQSDHLEMKKTTREQFQDPNNIDTFHILRLREENGREPFGRVAKVVYGYRGSTLGAFYNHFIAVNNSNHETEFSADTTEGPWTIVRADRRPPGVLMLRPSDYPKDRLCLGVGEFAALRFVNGNSFVFTRWKMGQPVRPLEPFPGQPLFPVNLPNGNSTVVYDMDGTLFLWRGTGYDMRINPSMAGILRHPRIREAFVSWDYTTMAVVYDNTVHVFCGMKPSMYPTEVAQKFLT